MSEISESEKNEWLRLVKDKMHLINLYIVSCLRNSTTYVGAIGENGNIVHDEPNPDFKFVVECIIKIQGKGSIDSDTMNRLNKLYKKWKHEFFEVQDLSKSQVVHHMGEDIEEIWDKHEPEPET